MIARRSGRLGLLLTASVVLLTMATVAGTSLSGIGAHGTPSPFGSSTSSSDSLAAIESAPRAPLAFLSGAPPTAIETGTYSGPTSVYVTFGLTNASELTTLLAEISNPQGPQYHHYLTESQFIARFSPPTAAYADAQSYFGAVQGLTVTSYSDRMGLLLHGPAASMDAAFGVSLDSYMSPERGTYYAPMGAPTLPQPVASAVVQVEGLSSYLDAQTMLQGAAQLPGPVSSPSIVSGYPAPSACGDAQCLYGSDLQVAYDEQSLLQIAFPTGEQVATILWAGCEVSLAQCPSDELTGGYDPNDVYSYYNATLPAGQPHSNVIGVPFDGAPLPGVNASYDVSGAVFENTLDIDMVGSMAPGSTVYNVYGVSSLDSETDAAMSYILSNLPDVQVISNSWGGQDHVDDGWISDMEMAAARGVTVLASSGDAGDSPTSSKWSGSAVEFPSTVGFDDYGVTAVGGTTLTVDPSSSPVTQYLHIVSQTTWYDPVYNDNTDQIGSSGGVSALYAEPSWQASSTANAVIQHAGGSHRGVPDLAAIANNTIILLTTDGGHSDEYEVWGTSVASPATAGMFAEIDAILNHYSTPSLGFVDPTVYSWADAMVKPFQNTSTTGFFFTGIWNSTLPSLPFYDVTTGMNDLYDAYPGYDLVTGWGSLDAYNFTTFVLSYNYSGESFSLNGVQSVLSLTGLNVTSLGVPYNASVQQNFYLSNSLGAPIYWVQNVIYIAGSPSLGWTVNYTGWVVFPFPGIYSSVLVYEYNFPAGPVVHTPITWTITSWLTDNGPNAVMNFEVNSQTLQLPVPGAAFIIGGYNYQYYWQGQEYTNGPFPDTGPPGGLAPQLGLVGGPSAGDGFFGAGTAATLMSSVQMSGQSQFVATPSAAAFGLDVDQTGETATNLVWSGAGASWTLSLANGGDEQGVVSYTVVNAGNPANESSTSYAVNFTESGLADGTNWTVTFNSQTETCAVGFTFAMCGSNVIEFSAQNGGYPYSANATGYSANPASGSVTVSGTATNIDITFTALVTYDVNFTETGLSDGTHWSVTLNRNVQTCVAGGGSPNCGAESNIFQAPNGGYTYAVNATGYSANPASGSFSVSGAPVAFSITFTQATSFSVVFTESGLSGSSWTVTLAGVPQTSSETSISFSETNGNYPFTVSATGYSADPASGSIPVNGAPYDESITFTSSTFTITFSQTGLGSMQWSVSVTGIGSMSSPNGGPIVFSGVSSGSYQFTVGSVSGYNASPSSGSLQVPGDVSRTITFTSSGGGGGGGGGIPPFTLFGLSGTNLIIVILGIVIVCVAVAAVSAARARRAPPAAATLPAPPPGPAPATYVVPPPFAPAEPVAPPMPTPLPPPTPVAPPEALTAPPPMIAVPTRSCPKCGTPVGATSHFCPECGAPLG